MTRSADTSDTAADAIETAAIRHFARERSGDPVARGELEQWLEADPRHRARYEELRRLWGALEPYRSEPAMLAMREEALQALRRHRWFGRALVGLAASLALTLGIGTIWYERRPGSVPAVSQPIPERQFSTRVGQMLSVALNDGSMAILDTNSAIAVRIGAAGERRTRVTRGRALFKVAKMPGRPFMVEAGTVVVTALGTRFDVYHRADGVDVNLVEGRLRVEETASPDTPKPDAARLEMAAGDRLQVRQGKWLLARSAIGRSADWVEGQLVFEQAPVSVIVGELSRYTDRKLLIADAAVANQRVSAIIRADDPLMFLNALETMHVAKVRQLPDGYLIETAGR